LHPKKQGSVAIKSTFAPVFYCGPCEQQYPRPMTYYSSNLVGSTWLETSQGFVNLSRINNPDTRQQIEYLQWINLNNSTPTISGHRVSQKKYYSSRSYLIAIDRKSFLLAITPEYRTANKKIKFQLWSYEQDVWKMTTEFSLSENMLNAYRVNQEVFFLTSTYPYEKVSLYSIGEKNKKLSLRSQLTLKNWILRNILVSDQKLYMSLFPRNTNYKSTLPSIRSRHFAIYNLSQNKFEKLYFDHTNATSFQLVSIYKNRLLVKIASVGMLIADISNPRSPKALHYIRTLGWVTSMEYFDDKLWLSAGAFGIFSLDLNQGSITSP